MARMPVAGEVIDDVFRVEAEIDSGNFGSVYKVHDMLEDRTLALKVLRPGPHDEGELRQRFEREARLIYSLQHRHIVRVYYYGETTSGLPYMAMEYLEGTDLRTLLHHHGSLNHALVKRITTETLSALASAHELGIIHRDLKPANIFLVKDGGKGHVKVLDFGFAKALDDPSPLGEITNAGTLVGTPAYMAPELVHKKRVGPAADIYAMGLIMAEMLKGDKILQIDAVYDTILFQASPENIKFGPEVMNTSYGAVIVKATQKSLERRYASAREMGADLGGLPEYEPEAAPVAAEPVHRKLFITDDLDDNDMTIPRALGLPSEEELARLMGKRQAEPDDSETGERTLEWGAEMRAQINAIDPQRQSSPPQRASTDDFPAARHTPTAHQTAVPHEPRPLRATPQPQRSSRTSPTAPRQTLRNSQAQPGHDRRARSTGLDLEIPDLDQYTAPVAEPRTTGVSEVLLGFVLGALLLGLIIFALYLNGNVRIE